MFRLFPFPFLVFRERCDRREMYAAIYFRIPAIALVHEDTIIRLYSTLIYLTLRPVVENREYRTPILILSPNLIRLKISPRLYLAFGEDPL